METAKSNKDKHSELREKALAQKVIFDNADDKTKEAEGVKFEAAKKASLDAKNTYDASKTKACQFIADESASLELKNPSNYVPTEKEKGHIHVELDMPYFSKTTGKKQTKAFIQKFSIGAFKGFIRKPLGYTVQVIWDGGVYKSI